MWESLEGGKGKEKYIKISKTKNLHVYMYTYKILGILVFSRQVL